MLAALTTPQSLSIGNRPAICLWTTPPYLPLRNDLTQTTPFNFWVRVKWNTVSPREQVNNRACVTLPWDFDRWSFRMESEEGRRGGELSDNPLLAHLVFVKMEDLSDRLKLLDYETRFCKQHKFKPFSR